MRSFTPWSSGSGSWTQYPSGDLPYQSDNRWVVGGWSGLWDTRQPWTPHWCLWQTFAFLREDVRQDVQVVWLRAHASGRARAQPGVWHRLAAAGNANADRLAKKAAAMHSLPVNLAVCVDRI